ncbi:hypothetical protein B0H11DRAFT_2273769 [Mycena galericulata]|nr:hypothetical protein B0H11DRAFT_2273769 [Mycena galericulata]
MAPPPGTTARFVRCDFGDVLLSPHVPFVNTWFHRHIAFVNTESHPHVAFVGTQAYLHIAFVNAGTHLHIAFVDARPHLHIIFTVSMIISFRAGLPSGWGPCFYLARAHSVPLHHTSAG